MAPDPGTGTSPLCTGTAQSPDSAPAGLTPRGQLFLIHTKVPHVRYQERWYQESGPGENRGLGFQGEGERLAQQKQKVVGGEAGGQHRAAQILKSRNGNHPERFCEDEATLVSDRNGHRRPRPPEMTALWGRRDAPEPCD